eukprot:scaffold20.g7707.t1
MRAVAQLAALAAKRSSAVTQLAVAGSRGLAEAAGKEIKLPPQHGVAGRYAAALYMAAVKANKLDGVEGELEQVATLLSESADFAGFINDPSVPTRAKTEGLNAVLSKLGASDITSNFVGLLTDNNRLGELPRILDKFEEIAAEQRGEVRAVVTTAEGLSMEEKDEVARGLKQLLKPGQTLALEEKVDPTIIGGVVIDIGDKHVDLSILSRVKKLQQISPESRAEGLNQAVQKMVLQLEGSHLRPMQKESFLCSAKCCDTAPGPQELQQCINACERKVQVANNLVNSMMHDFQQRVQRCVQRCQDKAQEALPAQPSEKEIAKAQLALAECIADCAQEYEKQARVGLARTCTHVLRCSRRIPMS